MSVDAIFGLCRKKSAGNSVRGPLSGMSVFESQDEVNTFIDLQGHSIHSQSEVYTCTYTHNTYVCVLISTGINTRLYL